MQVQTLSRHTSLPPPVLDAGRRDAATTRDMIAWARASAQAGPRRGPPPRPASPPRRKPSALRLTMLAAGQAGFLGAGLAGVALMVG